MKKRKKLKTIRALQKQADSLYQSIGKLLMPVSIISGKSVEVIHHFFTKQSSSRLRYDLLNGVPLTRGEHFSHHIKSDPTIHAKIIAVKGQKWYQELEGIKRESVKTDRLYYQKTLEELNNLSQ